MSHVDIRTHDLAFALPATSRRSGRSSLAGAAAAILALALITPAHAQKPAASAARPSPPSPAASAAPTHPEAGVWIDDTGKGAVEIAPCGEKLCGKIVWLDQPFTKKGTPVVDDLNPNKSLRNQPVCGLQVIGELARQGDGSWDAGWVYDPKTGERYDLAIKMKSADHLAVTGYLGMKMLGETFTWTRAPAAKPLPACNVQAAGAR